VTASGSGDVTGPSSAVGDNFASFNSTTGKLIKDSGKKASDFETAGAAAAITLSGLGGITSADAIHPNTAITPGTKTKISYDAKGLVTAGADATAADVGAAATGAITTSGLTMTAANKLAGRATTGAGAVEEITLGTNLSLSGTTLNAAGGGSLSSTTPAMNGTATVGVEAAASHGDHVHPTDTSLLPKIGGTIKPVTNSSTTLLVQDSAATNVLSVDTTNKRVQIGTNAAAYPLTITGAVKIFGNNSPIICDNDWGEKWQMAGTSCIVSMDQTNTAWAFIIGAGGVNKFRFSTTKSGSIMGPIVDFMTSGDCIFYGKIGVCTTAPATKLHAVALDTATAAVTNILTLDHDITGTPAAGSGTGINLLCDTTTTASQQIGNIAAVWTDATFATRTSKLTFSTVNSGTTGVAMQLLGNGTPVFPSIAVYADNTAALAGGLTAGMVYRTATGVLMVTY
jgi:hypothetical protein